MNKYSILREAKEMKQKLLSLLALLILLTVATCQAEGNNIIEMWQKPDKTESKIVPQVDNRPLYGKYPLVGADNASGYYLDTSSCTAYQDGEKYIIACIVYSTSSGSPPRVSQSTYKFDVHKFDDNFIVGLESINDSAEEAQQMLQYDNGYLRFLFLQAAKYSQYPSAKIQALNAEAESQLQKVADEREAEYQRQQAEERVKAEASARAAKAVQPQYQTYSDSGYIGNANSGIFHHSYCPSVGKMNPGNKVSISSREEAISQGYRPCKRCRP